MPVNLEQAKRLKEAGWKQDKSELVIEDANNTNLCFRRSVNPFYIDSYIDAPTEKEMMEFLGNAGACVIIRCLTGWTIILGERSPSHFHHTDLTEALVQACEKVLEGREGR